MQSFHFNFPWKSQVLNCKNKIYVFNGWSADAISVRGTDITTPHKAYFPLRKERVVFDKTPEYRNYRSPAQMQCKGAISTNLRALWRHSTNSYDMKWRLSRSVVRVNEIPELMVGYKTSERLITDRLCGLVARVLGYRSGSPGSIPGTTSKKSSGSGTGSTQPREYNWVATW
jgi:hypothetical protein